MAFHTTRSASTSKSDFAFMPKVKSLNYEHAATPATT